MALNLEIKARIRNMAELHERIRQLTAAEPELLKQEDTFFKVPRGRLKMRCDPSGCCHLIYYHRPDELGPKISAYFTEPVENPEARKSELAGLFGQGPIVHKSRLLYRIEGSRLHIDEVEGLGGFLEIEIPLQARKLAHRSRVKALRLMKALGLAESDLRSEPYAELAQ